MLESLKAEKSYSAGSGLAHAVAGVTDRGVLLEAMTELLMRAIPSDAVGWNAVDKVKGTAAIDGQPAEVYRDPRFAPDLLAELDDHPMITSYHADSKDRWSPRRLSDLVGVRDLRRTRTYADLLRPLQIGHQLTVLTGWTDPGAGRCWTFARTSRPFSDDELEFAFAIQPVLVALETYIGVKEEAKRAEGGPDAATADAREEARRRYGLTAREVEVLSLVAGGSTAAACGRLLRISEATVRKHMEHVYAKLGCHDRLLAVVRARQIGMID